MKSAGKKLSWVLFYSYFTAYVGISARKGSDES
jgi:hypothetical protein